ncbi:hypothetical protein DERP_014868 [Dermatophagoides pteronyssinus]|uniref:Uncharacterized protein n=1 Tax=Dermatophagoides pteronyssinus TaxID=6956 RepID=A0ABQ8J4M9_DERPT|nr:hypothetical protein DERP_014868 [Dermatophagoides pteronyssinus]
MFERLDDCNIRIGNIKFIIIINNNSNDRIKDNHLFILQDIDETTQPVAQLKENVLKLSKKGLKEID